MIWLKKLLPPKPYRYIFYRLNIVSERLGNNPPAFSTLILMTMTTFFQFLFVLFLICAIFQIDIWMLVIGKMNPLIIIVFALIFLRINNLFFYYKNKWKLFINEFKDETERQRKRRGIYVILYVICSFGLFFVGLWLFTFTF